MGKKGTDVRHRPNTSKPNAVKQSFGYDYSKDYSDTSWPYYKGKLDRSGKIILVVFPTVIILGIAYVWYSSNLKARLWTPVDLPKVVPAVRDVMADDYMHRYWGTYRSHLYFGMKTRHSEPTVMGLMWTSRVAGAGPGWSPIRHWCEQGDRLAKYGWKFHDGKNFGVQQIFDEQILVATSFVKRHGGQHGGDWTAKIVAESKAKEDTFLSFFVYVATGPSGQIELNVKEGGGHLTSVTGSSADLGPFQFHFTATHALEVKYSHMAGEVQGLEQMKDIVERSVRPLHWKKFNTDFLALPGNRRRADNDALDKMHKFAVYEVTAKLPLVLEVRFESGSFLDRPNSLSGDVYGEELKKHLNNFETNFENTFGLQKIGYTDNEVSVAKATFSNLIGGISYMHGSSIVRSKYTNDDEQLSYFAAPLYTAVPSRSFFPRGFLWDEGFHNLLISAWDTSMSLDIIAHWLDLMNVEGWIPREQILDSEARARVPAKFVVQHNEVANPPALFLPLRRLADRFAKSTDLKTMAVLKTIFGRLKLWYNWYNSTQIGSEYSTYRWRGRDATVKNQLNPLTLASGLDDYPRASHPTDAEYHLDLRCWMALASKVMADLARMLGENYEPYESTYQLLSDNELLNRLHWSERAGRYSDYGLHTDSVKLVRPQPVAAQPGHAHPPPREKERMVTKEPAYQLVDNTFGYASLMPLVARLIKPDSAKLDKILTDLRQPNLLWSPYGLRSLAKSSPLYRKHNTEHDPPYWRGAVWINFNYLCLDALHHYSNLPGPYQDTAKQVYTDLRRNVVNNIIAQYDRTGYVWENYDDETGQGKGSHPFTGWSSLFVSIMAESF